MTQLESVGTTIGRHANESIQPNSTWVFIEYGASWFIHEGGINTTRIGDVGDNSILAFYYYQKGTGIEYLLEHEDSMEV